jgi:hypothetical protein
MTFVRKYSDGTVEEGPPSAPSNILVSANRQVTVTLPNGTMACRATTASRTSASTARTARPRFLVTEVAFASASAIDNTATALLGIQLTTTSYLPPPDGMKGLIALPNGCVAGFSGNTVYISEPYAPHAYPLLNQYTVPFPIVAIGNVGTAIWWAPAPIRGSAAASTRRSTCSSRARRATPARASARWCRPSSASSTRRRAASPPSTARRCSS